MTWSSMGEDWRSRRKEKGAAETHDPGLDPGPDPGPDLDPDPDQDPGASPDPDLGHRGPDPGTGMIQGTTHSSRTQN